MALYDCDVCGEYTHGDVKLITGIHARLCPEHRTEFDTWAQSREEWELLQNLDIRIAALIQIGEEEGAASYAKEGRAILKKLRPKILAWLEDVKVPAQ